MTAEELRKIAEGDRDGLAKAFQAMLVDFGYQGLTEESVHEHISAYMGGLEAGKGIIAKFIYGWMENGID